MPPYKSYPSLIDDGFRTIYTQVSFKLKAQSPYFTSISVWAFMVHVACNCAMTSNTWSCIKTGMKGLLLPVLHPSNEFNQYVTFTIVIILMNILSSRTCWSFNFLISNIHGGCHHCTSDVWIHVWFIYRLGITWRKNSRFLISPPRLTILS